MKSRPLLSIPETIAINKHWYFKHPAFKLLGILTFLAIVILPYYCARSHWHHLARLFPGQFGMLMQLFVPVGICFHLLSLLAYALLYRLGWGFFEQFKDNANPWPWQYDPEFKAKVSHAVKVVLFNNLVLGVGFSYLGYRLGVVTFRIEQEELPSLAVFCCQVVFMVLCEDTMFYHSHRLLHHPSLYPYVHKQHHEFYDVICLSSEYAHPVEYILGNLVPVVLGAILLQGRAHMLSQLVFTILRLIETIESHGGYDFPWAVTRMLPWSVSSRYHNYHHLKNLGCYGSFFILWDSVYGTNSNFFEEERLEKQSYLKSK